MKIKDIEVDFSFTNADDIERFEKAAKEVKEKSENYKKEEKSTADVIRDECNIIEEFFENVFGKGISEKLFNGKKDLKEHSELFLDIVKEKVEQTKSFQDMYNNFEYRAKYMPNRATRRYNKFQGRK